jgi:hypothetical protein
VLLRGPLGSHGCVPIVDMAMDVKPQQRGMFSSILTGQTRPAVCAISPASSIPRKLSVVQRLVLRNGRWCAPITEHANSLQSSSSLPGATNKKTTPSRRTHASLHRVRHSSGRVTRLALRGSPTAHDSPSRLLACVGYCCAARLACMS